MTNYIFEYYQAIKDGSILAGRWIVLWYEIVIKGLEDGRWTYNAKAADKAIKFIERFCRHHEGARAPQLIVLELWQKAFISVIFGIYDLNGDRQYREVVLIIGRKNGKTLLAAAIAAYMAYLDGEYGGRIYFAATKREQAELCYDACFQMILKEPLLSKRAQKRRTDIYIAESNTSLRTLSYNARRADGLNPSAVIADEIAAWSGEAGLKFYEVLKSALGARRHPMLISISTAGYINDGIYDELMTRCTGILTGNSKENRLAPFLYMIDDPQKWNDINELRKSNPNMGVSVSVDFFLEEINVAESSLSKKSEFVCKYCNLKANSSTCWFDFPTVEKACGAELHLEDFRRHYAVVGIDLSKTIDLTSVCAVIEHHGELYVFSQFYMPKSRIETATAEDGVPYDIYRQNGWLTLSGENHVDYKDVYGWIRELQRTYDIIPLVIGYDRYSAQYLIDDLKKDRLLTDDVYQGHNLTPVIRELEGLMRDGKVHIGNNNLLKLHLLNSALKADIETGKCKLVKSSKRARIDGTAALLDAFCVRQKWWSEFGPRLQNPKR